LFGFVRCSGPLVLECFIRNRLILVLFTLRFAIHEIRSSWSRIHHQIIVLTANTLTCLPHIHNFLTPNHEIRNTFVKSFMLHRPKQRVTTRLVIRRLFHMRVSAHEGIIDARTNCFRQRYGRCHVVLVLFSVMISFFCFFRTKK
jgi:hypothetical protein